MRACECVAKRDCLTEAHVYTGSEAVASQRDRVFHTDMSSILSVWYARLVRTERWSAGCGNVLCVFHFVSFLDSVAG